MGPHTLIIIMFIMGHSLLGVKVRDITGTIQRVCVCVLYLSVCVRVFRLTVVQEGRQGKHSVRLVWKVYTVERERHTLLIFIERKESCIHHLLSFPTV